ncbi:MAG: Trm112 family protein [Myxococcales bacterium]|nr:Trm112 family protein [Myxococcales bacterium]
MSLDASLLSVLACPKCKGPLQVVTTPEGFACSQCQLLYKTDDDIPNFLIDEALPWKAKGTSNGSSSSH